MIARIVWLCTLLIALVFLPAAVIAADAPPAGATPPAQGSSAATAANLESRLANLEQQTAETNKMLEELRNALGLPPRNKLVPVTPTPPARPEARLTLEQRVEKLEQDVEELAGLYQKQVRTQLDLVKRLYRVDSGGNPVLELAANMADKDFREQMDRVVNESIHKTGLLVVVNRMPSAHWVKVNGADRWIPPTDEKGMELSVPVGTVTTELVGYEAPKQLTVCAPTYRQRLIIQPRPLPPLILSAVPIVEPIVIP